jgi:hypothetical protein
MNKIYSRLAFTNIKNNKTLYMPYIISGMVMIAMFYVMMFSKQLKGTWQGAGCGDIGGYNGTWMRNNSDFFIYISVLYKQLYNQKAQERGRNIQYSWHGKTSYRESFDN